MTIRTFRAASMNEALSLVRQELGLEARILSSREVRLRRTFPWQKPRIETEITAEIDDSPTALAAAQSSLAASTRAVSAETEPVVSINRIDAEFAQLENRLPERATGWTDPAAQRDTIDGLIARLHRAAQRSGREEMPEQLFQVYTSLIESEMDEEDARNLVNELQQETHDEGMPDVGRVQQWLSARVATKLVCRGAITVPPGFRKTVALVGPTGSGKTMTAAKLAAHFHLREKRRVGLITLDTFRVAAVEQLRTYAEMISIPLRVASTPREFRRAIEEMQDRELVLIDTVGRSPRDELRIQELRGFLAEGAVDEIHLVLSLLASPRSLQTVAEKFAVVQPTHLILSKLDEAPVLGGMYSTARRIGLPLSYLSTGQNVPDDLEPAIAAEVSRWIFEQRSRPRLERQLAAGNG